MIPSRRGILLGLCSSAWAVLSCRGPYEKGLRPRAASERSGTVTEGDAFLRQFEGNRRRAYSEEGVAVYLVGENLAAGSTDGGHKPLAPSKWNRQFANRLRYWSQYLARRKPEVGPEDLPKLVEVMAEQDFGNGADSRFRP